MKRGRSAGILLMLAVLASASSALAARAPRPVFDTRDFQAVLEMQVRLDRAGFSPGIVDGGWGQNTKNALGAFAEANGLRVRSTVSREVLTRLGTTGSAPVAAYAIADSDLAGPFTEIPTDVYEKAKLDCLCYRSPLEEISERFHTSPAALKRLNPGADLKRMTVGLTLTVPDVSPLRQNDEAQRDTAISRLVVSKRGFHTTALGPQDEILYFFPSTLGSEFDPSPSDTLKITGIAKRPRYVYQPKLLADVPDSASEVELPPGPNSPVGLVWIDLSKPHLGIHGTDEPASIGHTTSHGCVRLTNWDAVFLAARVRYGVRVEFRD